METGYAEAERLLAVLNDDERCLLADLLSRVLGEPLADRPNVPAAGVGHDGRRRSSVWRANLAPPADQPRPKAGAKRGEAPICAIGRSARGDAPSPNAIALPPWPPRRLWWGTRSRSSRCDGGISWMRPPRTSDVVSYRVCQRSGDVGNGAGFRARREHYNAHRPHRSLSLPHPNHGRGLPGELYGPWRMSAVVRCLVASSTNMTWSCDVISFWHPTGARRRRGVPRVDLTITQRGTSGSGNIALSDDVAAPSIHAGSIRASAVPGRSGSSRHGSPTRINGVTGSALYE